MKIRALALRATAATAAAAAIATGSAGGQLPVPLEAQLVPIAPPVSQATYETRDFGKDGVLSSDDRAGTTTWRIVEATGNCCENYLTSSADGRLYDFGGTYVNFSDDRGLTWLSVRPLTPLVNGEGTIDLAPGGDVVGVGWDPYSGDHLQAFKYEAEFGKWLYTETPIHQPFYDREWVLVVPGPFTIDGETVPYITFLKGGYPSKELWYYSTDGLNYLQVSSKFVDRTLDGTSKSVATSARPDADWLQGNTNTGMTALGDGGVLAAGDYPSSSTWSVFDPDAFEWRRATLADGSAPAGLFQVDSVGRLHNVVPQGGRFTYRWSSDNGSTWASLEVPLPEGKVIEEIDFRANYAAAVAAVVVHAQDTIQGTDQDLVFKIGIGRKDKTPLAQRRYTVGLGDMNATAGLGNDVRMDFETVTVLPDGRVAVSFLDSTTKSNSPTTGAERPSPAIAIELNTKITGPRGITDPVSPAGNAQAPISGSVLVGAPGAGNRVAPVTSTYFEFAVTAGADDAAMIAQATQLLPGDIDLYLQRELSPGVWSGDLASGTSSSLADEVLESGRLLSGSRYRIEVHNWGGPPNSVPLQLTFFNSEGVAGT
ncbi:MAG TPA: hypothetical protein VFR38_02065 [Gaiellaceae bacterium]|nr:hypothetical protein [Gaiellaceae bacterium]